MPLSRLPKELIFEILEYCDGNDVLNFEEAVGFDSSRFISISDAKWWKRVTLRPPSDYKRCKKFMGKHTHSLKIDGSRSNSENEDQGKVSELLMSRILLQCPQITNLAIENTDLDHRIFSGPLIPHTTIHLKFSNLIIYNIRIKGDRDAKATISSQRNNIINSIKEKKCPLKSLEICEFKQKFLSQDDIQSILVEFMNLDMALDINLNVEEKKLCIKRNMTRKRLNIEHCIEEELKKKEKFKSVFKYLVTDRGIDPDMYISYYGSLTDLYRYVVNNRDVLFNGVRHPNSFTLKTFFRKF